MGSPRHLAPLLALALGGCSSLDAKAHNLRQLHNPDGSARFVASTMGDLEYLIRSTIGATGSGGVEGKQPERIDDPYDASFQNVLELAEFNPRNDHAGALQVELLSWLAVDDSYVLTRERAMLEMGPAGVRLGVELPLAPDPAAVPAGVAEVGDAIAALLAASRGRLLGPAAGPEAQEDAQVPSLAEALARLGSMPLDRAGAQRVLSVCTILLRRVRTEDQEFARIRELQQQMARFCVGRALYEGLTDRDPLVRAAALRACAQLGEEARYLVLPRTLLPQLGDPSELVRTTALRLIAAHGLPEFPDEVPQEDRGPIRERMLQALVDATQSLHGTEQVAACRALGAVSDAGFTSLRPEDWTGWWNARLVGPAPAESGS